jgi:hypothetical protein
MSQRQEFVEFARRQAVPLAELCRRFGISRKTGYKWLGRDVFTDAFDAWRAIYNHERPHQALALAVPASRYRPGCRPYPETLPPIEYGDGDTVVMVGARRADGKTQGRESVLAKRTKRQNQNGLRLSPE